MRAKAPDAYLVNRGEQAEVAALVLARSLRQAGLKIELDSSGSAFGKQFKRADRCGARWALVLGDDEKDRDEVRLKPLQGKGNETLLSLKDITKIVKTLRAL